ncbi:helix-turn-helix transcriptional regulator [Streptomyces lunaelactis]|nr:helix-turn-helix transcriptional regulator [Streptomyces lunaelactis]NUK32259.1 helix-turn-helix transcriptional regulator [Streptomyces lunaelactis]NUK41251.1 helix-turn-helix transcriptional regulator [Streptomyces lunaelactis]
MTPRAAAEGALAECPSDGRRCLHCRNPLSRYNRDQHCSGCSRLVPPPRATVPQVAAHIWGRADVQAALVERDFGSLCHLVRVHSSLRQNDMAELTGLSQAFLSMLESGVRRLTNIDRIVILLEGLEVPTHLTGPMLRMRRPLSKPDGGRWHAQSDAETA